MEVKEKDPKLQKMEANLMEDKVQWAQEISMLKAKVLIR